MDEIELPIIEPDTFRGFLTYLYTGALELTAVEAVNLMVLASMYCVRELQQACSEVVERCIHADPSQSGSPSLVFDVMVTAKEHQLDGLYSKCLSRVLSEGSKMLKSSQIAKLTAPILSDVLQSDDLCAAESEVFEAVAMWRSSSPSREQSAGVLMEHVRLPLVDIQHLITVVEASKLVPSDRLVDAMKFQVQWTTPHQCQVIIHHLCFIRIMTESITPRGSSVTTV